MKTSSLLVLGFLVALLCFSLFAPQGYLAIAAAYGGLLYLLFFSDAERSIPLLIGFTAGLELLGTARFGAAFLTSLLAYGSYLLFGLQLRWTARYPRFIVAMLTSFLALNATLYPWQGYPGRLLGLALCFFAVTAATALHRRSAEPRAYELL